MTIRPSKCRAPASQFQLARSLLTTRFTLFFWTSSSPTLTSRHSGTARPWGSEQDKGKKETGTTPVHPFPFPFPFPAIYSTRTVALHRLRSRKSLALICVGVVLFAACVPFVSIVFTAVLTPLWLVIPAVLTVMIRRTASRCDEQPVSLFSLVLSRAPPVVPAFA